MTDPAPTAEQIAEMRRRARACQVQHWHEHFTTHGDPMIVPSDVPLPTRRIAEVSIGSQDYGRAHCEFIGFADPATVDALAAALESARAELAAQRMRAEVAEARCWAVRPGSRAGDIECCLRRGHDGGHWATTGCAGSEITWPRIEAELAAERAKVQAVEKLADYMSGGGMFDRIAAQAVRAALAVAQPKVSP